MKTLLYGIAGALLSTSALASPFAQSVANQELVNHGKQAYVKRCAGCHGDKGDGKGPAAPFLDPKPRDFTSGVYKFRSSELGTLPSDQDLMHTLEKGVVGTSMPSFKFMPTQERFAIVQYLKTFSSVWKDKDSYGPAVVGSAFPRADFMNHDAFVARAKKGKTIFAEACVICHGKTGMGDGESAADLEDDWGFKVVPADLRKKTIKSGNSVQDIYRVLLTGVNGTPMPSFKDSYTDDQLWDLAAFVLYLRGDESGMYSGKKPITDITDKDLEL